VRNASRGRAYGSPAAEPQPPRQIRIFEVRKKPFVEQPNIFQSSAAQADRAAAGPEALVLLHG
jgi:hypothetical protein